MISHETTKSFYVFSYHTSHGDRHNVNVHVNVGGFLFHSVMFCRLSHRGHINNSYFSVMMSHRRYYAVTLLDCFFW